MRRKPNPATQRALCASPILGGEEVKPYSLHRQHWCVGEQEALGKAMDMADRKLKSFAKQTDKLNRQKAAWRNRLTKIVWGEKSWT